MLPNEAWAGSGVEALRSTSFAAGANNGPWLATSGYEGALLFLVQIGAVTGNAVFKLQDATDGSGTGAADLSPAVASSALSTAGDVARLVVAKGKIRSHVRLVATVTTGPILASGFMLARSKQTA